MPRLAMPHFIVAILFFALASTGQAERLLLQVEDFDGPWRRQANISGYHGTGFCTSNANPDVAGTVMRTTIEIGEAGHYAIWLRGYTSENSPRAMQVEVVGELLKVTHTGSQRRWVWEKAGEMQLAAGAATVVVHDADVGFETADAVLLTDDLEEDPAANDRLWYVYPNSLPDKANALRFNINACVALAQKKTDPQSPTEWKSRRPAVEQALQTALGFNPWPQKTPLNSQITGTCDRDTYTIENVLFESKPNFYVTANVYIPKNAPGPLPAIVVTAGHAMPQGKNYDLYRTAQLGLVRQGFLVLAYDPIGQGERQLPGNSHQVSYAALLTGKSNLHYMVWDSIRAVDYLLTRDDVDASRIGLTGNSGGGLNTMYTMPVEPRFAAGASFCCLCSYEDWIADGGNHCICNHLPGACREFEQFEFVALCSPRPFMSGNGSQDPIFPIAGVRKTIDRSRKIYAFEGMDKRVHLQEAPLPHGWSQPLREAAYGWFDRWLQDRGDGQPIAEVAIELEDWQGKDLQVLKNDAMPDDARTYIDLVRNEATRMIAEYPPAPTAPVDRDAWASRLRVKLWQLLGGEPEEFAPRAESLASFQWEENTVEHLSITTELDMELPALLIRPRNADGPVGVVVVLDQRGVHTIRDSKVVAMLLDEGLAVLALDVRGTGDIRVPENHCASDAIALGRPMLAQQAWDIGSAVRYLSSRDDVDDGNISLYGRGSLGTTATVAGALFDEVGCVVVQDSIGSFANAISDPLPQPQWIYAPYILTIADVPQLVALCPKGRFLSVNQVSHDKARVSRDAAEIWLQRVGSEANAAVSIEDSPAATIVDFIARP